MPISLKSETKNKEILAARHQQMCFCRIFYCYQALLNYFLLFFVKSLTNYAKKSIIEIIYFTRTCKQNFNAILRNKNKWKTN